MGQYQKTRPKGQFDKVSEEYSAPTTTPDIDPGDPLYQPGAPVTLGYLYQNRGPAEKLPSKDARTARATNIAARARAKEGDAGRRPSGTAQAESLATPTEEDADIVRKNLVGATLKKLSNRGY